MNKTMDYLTKEDLGGVIIKALAELYKKKPKYPITYLEEFFRRHLHDRHMEKRTQENIQKLKILEREVVEDEYIKWESSKKQKVTITSNLIKIKRVIQKKLWRFLR